METRAKQHGTKCALSPICLLAQWAPSYPTSKVNEGMEGGFQPNGCSNPEGCLSLEGKRELEKFFVKYSLSNYIFKR